MYGTYELYAPETIKIKINIHKLNKIKVIKNRNLFLKSFSNTMGTIKISTVENIVLILPPIVAKGPKHTNRIVDKQYKDNIILKFSVKTVLLFFTKIVAPISMTNCIMNTGLKIQLPCA